MKMNYLKTIRILQKSKTIALALIALTLSSGFDSYAQQKEWTLEDCINYALDNNIDVKKQLLLVNSQEADLLQSKLIMLPDLNAGATHGYNWGQTIDRYTNKFATERVQTDNFYLGSNLNLFTGLRQINTILQNKIELEASQNDLDSRMDVVSLSVALYYINILSNTELLDVAENQLDVTKQQVNRMKKMVDAGTLARGDYLNIEAQAAAEELSVVQATNSLSIAYLDLQQLIDLEVSDQFRIEKSDLRPIEAPSISITAQDIYQVALGTRPEIKSAELRVMSAEKGLSIARGYMSPVLSFNGTWATGYSGQSKQDINKISDATPIGYVQETDQVVVTDYPMYSGQEVIPFNDQLNNNQNKSLGLSLQIPIYNGWQVRTAISKAKIAQVEADYNLKQTKLNLNKIIQQAYADAVAALRSYQAAEKKVNAQKEAFKYAEQKFEVGLMNSVEYNQTKKDLNASESELLQAKYNFIYTTTVLDFYMGKPLTLKY